MKLDNVMLKVPYYSQFLDIDDKFWMLRACGATCLKMVSEYLNKEAGDIISLCNEAKEKGGYHVTNGWVHDYLVNKFVELGLKAERAEGMDSPERIIESLKNNNPVIVSVEKRVLEQTRFHIIVIVGLEDGMIVYHDPESTDRERGQYRKCSLDNFINYWRGKAIFISK